MEADPVAPRMPSTYDLDGTIEGEVLARWDRSRHARGRVRGSDGKNYFYRIEAIELGPTMWANILLVAPEEEFAKDLRKLQSRANMLAFGVALLFVPLGWFFGTRMSGTIQAITAEAARLQTMAAPSSRPIASFIREMQTLGDTIHRAQRAVYSFARLNPREIVRGVLDDSISTELGGVRQEITALFTDVRGFTTLSETADPDVLMQQTSRYFTALTDVIIAEGGTVDKYIGDGIMAFWNAPNPQGDHCERACRAALLARQANERINREFAEEGLPPFHTRFGIHMGEAVVGNLGSSERMNYTALGNVVNLAARLEQLNKQYDTEILISEDVLDRLAGRFRTRYVDSVVAKGMVTPTRVHELLGEVQAESSERGSEPQGTGNAAVMG
jgi:adenylate cyclase